MKKEIQMTNERFSLGIDALHHVAEVMGEAYSIQHRFKKYGYEQKVCTVRIFNKSFSKVGNDALVQAIREAVIYAVRTFSKFEELRGDLERILAEQEKACLAQPFEIKKFIDAREIQ